VQQQTTVKAIRLDIVPDMISEKFTNWAIDKGITLMLIQPGKPNCPFVIQNTK